MKSTTLLIQKEDYEMLKNAARGLDYVTVLGWQDSPRIAGHIQPLIEYKYEHDLFYLGCKFQLRTDNKDILDNRDLFKNVKVK